MLIAHLITGLQYGGSERQLAQLVLNSDGKRFRHAVISLTGGGAVGRELSDAGIEVNTLGMTAGMPSVAGILRLRQLLKKWKPDVLHCWLYHACLMGVICGPAAGTPRVLWGLRSANRGLRGYSWRTRAVVRLCARFSRNADCIIVNSETSWQVHAELGYAPRRMQIIPNGVDSERFRPNSEARDAVRAELGVPATAALVGMFAGYRPAKDHQTFLRAAGLVRAKLREIHYLLAGEGIRSDNAALMDLIKANELEGVIHLLGPRSDMERLTAALDIACLSSWSESFPNVIAEAMSCEVPCVTTDVGDAAQIIGNGGVLVPAQNPEAMAQSCMHLVAIGERGRKELGIRGRHRVEENFTVAKSRWSYENLYEEMRAGLGSTEGRTGRRLSTQE